MFTTAKSPCLAATSTRPSLMKRILLILAIGPGVTLGVVAAGPAKDPPPPIYIGPTPAKPRPPAEPPTAADSASAAAITPAAASPPSAPAQPGAADLEKLAMPIALHPDPLIAIILPAA